MLSIARFNWPFYAAAVAFLILSAAAWRWLPPHFPRLPVALMLVGSGYFLCVSLGVSYLVYDRSDLYRWHWLDRAFDGAKIDRAIFCHSGFDETSAALRERFSATEWILLDHFDAALMTEPSIHRARRLYPPSAGTLSAPYRQWPVGTQSAEAVFGLLAIHELRSEAERAAWFAEAKRCLRAGGCVILVEHVRDLANFLAFGPGFLHFHSPASWQRSWEVAGWHLDDHFRITPWVRVFILRAL